MQDQKGRIAVLGASGTVGRRIIERLAEAGFHVFCQTRSAEKLAALRGRVVVHVFDPRDAAKMSEFVSGVHAVIFALGADAKGTPTLISDVTAVLISAMKAHQVRRLIAITGVGAGDTRGHGGFVYDWIVYPLFTRKRYVDKDRQEALIAASGLDWIIVRPAPFSETPAPVALEVYTQIKPETRLTRITRDEVAAFVVAQVDGDQYLRQRPFIGHG